MFMFTCSFSFVIVSFKLVFEPFEKKKVKNERQGKKRAKDMTRYGSLIDKVLVERQKFSVFMSTKSYSCPSLFTN